MGTTNLHPGIWMWPSTQEAIHHQGGNPNKSSCPILPQPRWTSTERSTWAAWRWTTRRKRKPTQPCTAFRPWDLSLRIQTIQSETRSWAYIFIFLTDLMAARLPFRFRAGQTIERCYPGSTKKLFHNQTPSRKPSKPAWWGWISEFRGL